MDSFIVCQTGMDGLITVINTSLSSLVIAGYVVLNTTARGQPLLFKAHEGWAAEKLPNVHHIYASCHNNNQQTYLCYFYDHFWVAGKLHLHWEYFK